MSDKCKTCGQDLPDVKDVIEKQKYNLMYELEVGDSKTYDGFDLKMVSKNEHEEGNWSTNVSFVVEYNGSFYKKTGEYASHSGLDWDFGVKEVFPKERTVVDYE